MHNGAMGSETPKGDTDPASYLSGNLLIAMPTMRDPRFSRTVIYMCAHNAEGAMGIVVNRLIGSLSYTELLKQLGFEGSGSPDGRKVHFGGPVETSRGFVLHTTDKLEEGSLLVDDDVALTSTTRTARSSHSATRAGGQASSTRSSRPTPGSTCRPTPT